MLVAWCAVSASAQVNGSTRPYRALFGGSTADPDVHHNLELTLSVLGAYDDNVFGADSGEPGLAGSPYQESGFYSGYLGAATYGWRARRIQIGANVSTEARYYAERAQFIGVSHAAGFGVAAELGRRTNLLVNQSFSVSPAYLYGVFPELGPVAVGDVIGVGEPISGRQVHVFNSSASLNHGFTSRASVELIAELRYSDFEYAAGPVKSLRSYGVGGRYRHGLTRNAALRLGYVYREGAYGVTADRRPSALHDIDAGLDYRRALSFSRRTTLNFGMGSTLSSAPVVAGSASDQTSGPELQYRLVGDVSLTHEMGRTWRASLAYNRGVGYSEAFVQPVYSDGVNAVVTGFFNRRTDFSANRRVFDRRRRVGAVVEQFQCVRRVYSSPFCARLDVGPVRGA